jgi:hypothetical protein
MLTPEWPPLDPGPVQEWTPATVADGHGQRLRRRRISRRLPQFAYDAGYLATSLPFLRSVAPLAALGLCLAGLWAGAIVAMLAGILAQLMIMERGE